jgi:hypothetical protein
MGVFKEAWTGYRQARQRRQAKQCQRDLTKAFAEKASILFALSRNLER